MREDPIISGGILKAALVLLVGGALGVGAYSLAGGGIDINLPDLPEIDTLGETTTLENTTLQDTTIGEETPDEPAAAVDPFTSAGLDSALGQVRDAVGLGSQLTQVTINPTQTQFIVRRGSNEVEAYSVRADTGALDQEEATITISGDATIGDFAFALSDVDPAAVDRMLAAGRKESGAADFEPTVLSLERAIPFGSRELRWTINAQGGGRNLMYRASADGSKLENVGGAGTAIPPAAQEAKKLNDCIQAANNDPNEIFACLDRFR